MRLNAASAAFLALLDDALQDVKHALNDFRRRLLVSEKGHALFDEVLLDLGCAVGEALIEAKVSLDKEVDGLGNDFFVFAVENDSPDHFAFFKLAGIDHYLEAWFVIFADLHLFGVLLNEVRLPSSALTVVGLSFGFFLLEPKQVALVLVYRNKIVLQELEADEGHSLDVKKAIFY